MKPSLLRLIIGLSLAIANSALGTSLRSEDIELDQCVVKFAQEVRVPALASGRIDEITVLVNDGIRSGDPIARLDDRSLLIRRISSSLRVDSAKQKLSDDVEIRYAQTALAEAEAELNTDLGIQADVGGAVSKSRIRKLRLAVERAKLEVARAIKNQNQLQIEVGLREADLAVIDDQLRNLHIASPIEGVVLNVDREKGEWIERGDTLATIAQMDRLHVLAYVTVDAISPSECKGLKVEVHWNEGATPQILRGKVLSVDPQVLPQGKYRLRAEIVNQRHETHSDQWKLVPGIQVGMRLKR